MAPVVPLPLGLLLRTHAVARRVLAAKTVWRPRAHGSPCSNEKGENWGSGALGRRRRTERGLSRVSRPKALPAFLRGWPSSQTSVQPAIGAQSPCLRAPLAAPPPGRTGDAWPLCLRWAVGWGNGRGGSCLSRERGQTLGFGLEKPNSADVSSLEHPQAPLVPSSRKSAACPRPPAPPPPRGAVEIPCVQDLPPASSAPARPHAAGRRVQVGGWVGGWIQFPAHLPRLPAGSLLTSHTLH